MSDLDEQPRYWKVNADSCSETGRTQDLNINRGPMMWKVSSGSSVEEIPSIASSGLSGISSGSERCQSASPIATELCAGMCATAAAHSETS